jgi:PAS domain S-box-containing protein
MGHTRSKPAARWSDAQLFQLLADKSPYGVLVFENGKIAYANQSLAKLMGCPKREVKNWTVEDFLRWVHEEDRRAASEQYAQLLAGKPSSKRHEFRFVDRKGAVHWVDSAGTLLKKDGKTILQATVMDITDRKAMEQALRESAEKYRPLVEPSLQGMVVFQDDGIVHANQAAAAIAGLPLAEYPSWGRMEWLVAHLHPDDREMVVQRLGARLKGQPVPARYECRVIQPADRSVRWIDVTASRTQWTGRPAIQVLVSDITDRKRREEALRASEQQSRNLYDNAEAGLFRSRISDGKILECNQKLAEMFGYDSRELYVAEFVASEHYVDPHIRAQMVAQLKQTGEVRNFEAQVTRKDGTPIWVSYSGHAYPKEGYFEGAMVDITETKQAEEALLESEEKYKTLYHNAEVGLFRTRVSDGKLLECNEKLGRMFGYDSREEILAAGFKASEHYVDSHAREQMLARLKQTGQVTNFEVNATRKDGSLFWISYSGHLYPKEGYMEGVMADITERKQAEAALRESEEKYRELFETMREGINATDLQGRILDCNPAYADMLGYSKDELLKLSYQQLTPERWHQSEARIMKDEVLKRGYSDPYEAEYIRKDGTVFPITVQVFLVTDKAGKPEGTWGITNDITERKQADDKVRASEEQYRLLYENLADGLFIFDREGKIKMCNARAAELFGYTPSELLETHFEALVPADDRERVSRQFEDGIRNQTTPPGGLEARGIRKDGSILFFHVVAKLLRQNGEPQGLQALVRDMTQRKLQEKRTEDARNRAEFFIDLMSHDFNNINQGILSTLELALSDPDLPPASHEQIQLACDQVLRSADLIGRVKKIARLDLEAPQLTVRDIGQVLLKAVEVAKSSVSAKTLKLTTNIREGAYQVLADELLNDVFINLLHNAMKFDQSKRVAVEVKATRDRKKKLVKIEFKDWGPGVPDDAKERILSRLTSRQEQRTRTSGIGLTLVRGIVDRYGGQIWVEDRVPGDFSHGANFVVLLPMAK